MRNNRFWIIGVFFFAAAFSGACEQKSTETGAGMDTIPIISPVIMRQIPHLATPHVGNPMPFTQGLVYYDGLLYESTGLNCCSSLRSIDPQSGAVINFVDLDGSMYFAEGLAIKDNQLVQLTWISHIAFTYSLPGMDRTGQLAYGGQGWGLTANDAGYIMSNGTDTLYFRNDAFALTRKLPVTRKGLRLTDLNELEYVNGKVYANVWRNDSIYIISPANGEVAGIIDCTGLAALAKQANPENVLNGIAFDKSTGLFYITGKRWPVIFEAAIPGG